MTHPLRMKDNNRIDRFDNTENSKENELQTCESIMNRNFITGFLSESIQIFQFDDLKFLSE